MFEEEAKVRQIAGVPSKWDKGKSSEKAAQVAGVSPRSVERARAIEKTEGADYLLEAVRNGTISLSAAGDISTLPLEEQEEIIAGG